MSSVLEVSTRVRFKTISKSLGMAAVLHMGLLVGCGSGELQSSSSQTSPRPVTGAPDMSSDLPAEKPGDLVCEVSSADELFVLNGINLQTANSQDLRQALKVGQITSEALVERQLQLIAAYDSPALPNGLNSIRTLAPDAIEQARAADAKRRRGEELDTPFAGLTVLLKDNVGTQDMPTTAGSIALANNIPKFEATITTQLRESGAIVLGKTNLSEFANWMDLRMPNGYSSLGGQVIAPYDFDLDPSGSSTGSGVAGTMAFATATIGSETSGSIISPATRHSLAAVKPTIGLVSRVGVIPLAHSFDTAGPMARNVTDAAALLQLVAGSDPLDDASPRFDNSDLQGQVPDYLAGLQTNALEGVRIGVRDTDINDPAPFADALDVLRSLGAELVVFDADQPPSTTSIASLGAIFNEFKLFINRYLVDEAGSRLPAYTLTEIIDYNRDFPEQVQFGQSLLELSDAQTGLELDPVYVASRETAIRTSQNYIDTILSQNNVAAIVGPNGANTGVTAAAGYPNVTVPMGYTASGPQGISFAGGAFTEAQLLAYAFAYEQASLKRQAPTTINSELIAACKP